MVMRLVLVGIALSVASCTSGTPARPIAPLATYISSDDYPTGLEHHQEGRVSLNLDIEPSGRVVACRVTESSGSAQLDRTACRVMRSRARFEPARNARGVAVAGRFRAAVQWTLPAD